MAISMHGDCPVVIAQPACTVQVCAILADSILHIRLAFACQLGPPHRHLHSGIAQAYRHRRYAQYCTHHIAPLHRLRT